VLNHSTERLEDLTIGSLTMKLEPGFKNVIDLTAFDDRTGRIAFLVEKQGREEADPSERFVIVTA
jgi:hypothetical protein